MSKNNRIPAGQYILDKAGMWTSALCAIHCIGLPLLMSVTAYCGLTLPDSTQTEIIILSVSVILGVASLFPSYFRHHRKFGPVGILLAGFTLIGLSRFMVDINESVFTSSGAVLVASAHFFNYKLCQRWHNRS